MKKIISFLSFFFFISMMFGQIPIGSDDLILDTGGDEDYYLGCPYTNDDGYFCADCPTSPQPGQNCCKLCFGVNEIHSGIATEDGGDILGGNTLGDDCVLTLFEISLFDESGNFDIVYATDYETEYVEFEGQSGQLLTYNSATSEQVDCFFAQMSLHSVAQADNSEQLSIDESIKSVAASSSPSCSPCTTVPWETKSVQLELSGYFHSPLCRAIVEYKFRMCNGIPEFEIISITANDECACVTFGDLANLSDLIREKVMHNFYANNFYGTIPDCYDYLTITNIFESSCFYPTQVSLPKEVAEWLNENFPGEATTFTKWLPCDATNCCVKETSLCMKTNPVTGNKYLFLFENILSPTSCDVPAPDGSLCWPTCGYVEPPVPLISASNTGDLEEDQLTISPNPSFSFQEILVEFKLKVEGKVTIGVYNLQGQQVLMSDEFYTKGKHFFKIDNNSLNNGTYTIYMQKGSEVNVAKFIIIN